MCYRIQVHHKKCGHRSTVNVYCPLAPRHPTTRKPVGKFCQKSKANGKVYKKHGTARSNWKCPKDECKYYERLRRYWRCCACRKGPNKEPFCKQTVRRQSFEHCRSRSVSRVRGGEKDREGKRERSWSPKREAEGRGDEGVRVERRRSPIVSETEAERGGRSRRGSISTYRRTCGHQPCSKCTWFGATIPTYSQQSGGWTRNGSGSESDTIDESSSQPEPEAEEEPMEFPDNVMTDTEFDPELYIEDYEEVDAEADTDVEEESEQYYDAVERMDVVESVEVGSDLRNVIEADMEAEDDAEDEDDSPSVEEMEVDAEDDSDDDGPEVGTLQQYRDPEEMSDAEFSASVRRAQRGSNGMSFTESQNHDLDAMTDAEFNASVRRVQRGANGMSFTESPEYPDEDSEATISDPEKDCESGNEDYVDEDPDNEQAGKFEDNGSETEPRESQLVKPQQTNTTEGHRDPSKMMEEGGPVLSLEGVQSSPDGFLPQTSDGT